MISLYSKHGKHKRVAKFKSYIRAAIWIEKNWNDAKVRDPNYFLTDTKT